MPNNFPGGRSHGGPQETEMDMAWQELMAITELQVILYTKPKYYVVCLIPVVLSTVCYLSRY